MNTNAKPKVGHAPTLLACFLHFDLSFMLWVLLGALGVFAAESLGLSPAQKGLMVATPILGGSVMRVPIGLLSDRVGAKRTGMALLAFLFLPLGLGWLWASSFSAVLAVGLMLGTAGASFAVALPLASRWYPPEKQGLAMGIAAAGNSGTVISNLLAPKLATLVGWHAVFALAMIPLAVVLFAFSLLAREAPREPFVQDRLSVLRQKDLYWFCGFYSITFGGYVGLCSFLPLFFRDQYGVSPLTAGHLTALAAFAGSLFRPVGGYLADRIGGGLLLMMVLVGAGAVYGVAAWLPEQSTMVALLVVGMVCLGMGNGAVFQMVPQRFARRIGAATGIIGAVGGLGGFFLPTMLGAVKQRTGSFSAGLMILGVGAICAAAALGVYAASSSARSATGARDEVA